MAEKKAALSLPFAHGQGDETFFGQFEFPPLGNQDFGGYLGLDGAHGLVLVQRQVFHGAAALGADDVGAPAVFGEAVGDAGGKGKGGIAPSVVFMAGGYLFLVVEALDRLGVRPVGEAQQETGQGETNIARIFGFPERLPLDVLRPFQDRFDVLEVGQGVVVFDAEKIRLDGGNERRMRHGGHCRRVLEQPDVLRSGAELIVADQTAVGLAAELAVFAGVDGFVETRI